MFPRYNLTLRLDQRPDLRDRFASCPVQMYTVKLFIRKQYAFGVARP